VGVASIMTAHVLFTALDKKRPATIAPEVLAILREELGYDGVVWSDDLEMKAVADHVRPDDLVDGALHAGVDGLLVCSDAELREIVLRRLERQPDAKVERSIARMVELKSKYVIPHAASEGLQAADDPAAPQEPEGPPYPEHVELAETIRSRR
jgi:beta-N-acetylhexosaminidase